MNDSSLMHTTCALQSLNICRQLHGEDKFLSVRSSFSRKVAKCKISLSVAQKGGREREVYFCNVLQFCSRENASSGRRVIWSQLTHHHCHQWSDYVYTHTHYSCWAFHNQENFFPLFSLRLNTLSYVQRPPDHVSTHRLRSLCAFCQQRALSRSPGQSEEELLLLGIASASLLSSQPSSYSYSRKFLPRTPGSLLLLLWGVLTMILVEEEDQMPRMDKARRRKKKKKPNVVSRDDALSSSSPLSSSVATVFGWCCWMDGCRSKKKIQGQSVSQSGRTTSLLLVQSRQRGLQWTLFKKGAPGLLSSVCV